MQGQTPEGLYMRRLLRQAMQGLGFTECLLTIRCLAVRSLPLVHEHLRFMGRCCLFFISLTLSVILLSHPQATRPEDVDGLVDREELADIRRRRAEISKDLNYNVELTKRMYEALDGCINRIGE